MKKATVDFILKVTNPTPHSYWAELIEYEIYLQGIRVGNGSMRDLKLEPNSQSLQRALLTYTTRSWEARSSQLS